MRIIILLLAMILMLTGCAPADMPDASISPLPTQTPEPTQEPTPTPNIPPVDESLMNMDAITDLLIEEWPDRACLSYRHSNGMVFDAEGYLHKGGGFVIYLLNNTGYAPSSSFTMDDNGDGSLLLRPVPENGSEYTTAEGLYIRPAEGEATLEQEIRAQENENFSLIKRDNLAYWNGMFDSSSMLYGALPYEGSYAQLQFNYDIQHLLLIETEHGSFLITLRIEQMREPTQLYYFLCSMLSTFRITNAV